MSEIKILKDSEKVFDLEIDMGRLKKQDFNDVKRITIKLKDKEFRIEMNFDGGFVINKQDYVDSSTIGIKPNVSNEIIIY